MQGDNSVENNSTQASDSSASTQETVSKPALKYSQEDVNSIIARVRHEEREKTVKKQHVIHQESEEPKQKQVDVEKLVDDRVNARLEAVQQVAFERQLAAKIGSRTKEGEQKYSDFWEVVDAFDMKEDRPLLNEIAGFENSEDLLYALGKKPTLADSFNRGLSSANAKKRTQAAKELKEFADSHIGKSKKELKEPPAPSSRMKNSANVFDDNDGEDMTEKYKRQSLSRY